MSTWAFLDHENLPDLEHLDLSRYERILVFRSRKSKKTFKLDGLPEKTFCRLDVLTITTQGKNNLDFHLAFYLGCLHQEADPAISFHILSKDQGFDGLIHHLKTLNRKCKRVQPTPPPKPTLSEPALRVAGLLEKAGRARPRKKASLLNWISNRGLKVNLTSEQILRELQKAGQLHINNEAVTYALDPVPGEASASPQTPTTTAPIL